MPVIIPILALLVIVLVVLRARVRAELYHKAHPSLEEQRKALTRAYSMDDTMSTEDYEQKLDQLLRSKHG